MIKINIVQGDITQFSTDAIVNAANSTLLGGGGVDGAIHEAAGRELIKACILLGGGETGEAKITPGFRLKSKWVIHTVGPFWQGGNQNEDELLATCYRNCLKLAKEHQLKSIAFPAISTGAYGFPLERATEIAIREILKAETEPGSLEEIDFVCYDAATLEVYREVARRLMRR